MARIKYTCRQLAMLPKPKHTSKKLGMLSKTKQATDESRVERPDCSNDQPLPKTTDVHEKLASSKNPCRDYCCSAFALFEDEKVTKISPPELNNPIHPIFRPENFSAEINTYHYDMLKPSLRLASHLLQSDALIPYLNTYFDGDVHNGIDEVVSPSELDIFATEADVADGTAPYVGCPLCDRRAWITPKPGQDKLNDKTRKRAKDILEHMADMVEFDLPPLDDKTTFDGATGVLSGPLDLRASSYFPRSCRCTISIKRKSGLGADYGGVDYLTWFGNVEAGVEKHTFDPPLAPDQLLILRFDMARVLVHEVGHAIHSAAYGRRPELYYLYNDMVECGYQVEAILFGGTLGHSDDDQLQRRWQYRDACEVGKSRRELHRIYTLREWPSTGVLELYRRKGDPAGSRTYFRKADIYWCVPRSYVEALFSNDFWSRLKVKPCIGGVMAPKVASWAFGPWKDQKGFIALKPTKTRRKRENRKAAKALKAHCESC